jgi:hypothetical protein
MKRDDPPAFFSSGPAGSLYAAHLEHGNKTGVRQRIEDLWARYHPYCPDSHFLTDARKHFVQRTWEMYFACALLDAGFELERPPPKGPDILTTVDGSKLWIEAVAPTVGEGPDAVPGREKRGRMVGRVWSGSPPSDESLILRCASALTYKLTKWQEYVSQGAVAHTDRFAIAISLGDIDEAFLSDTGAPVIMKALFPIGPYYMAFPVGRPDVEPQGGYQYRDKVMKRRGSAVATTLLEHHPVAKSLVGVFFTEWGIWNAPAQTGHDIVFVHNPFMNERVREGAFPFLRDEWIPGPDGTITRRKSSEREAPEGR